MNAVVRLAVKPVAALTRHPQLLRIPVAGITKILLSGEKPFKMKSSGDDVIATTAFYLGALGFEPEMLDVIYRLLEPGQVFLTLGPTRGYFP